VALVSIVLFPDLTKHDEAYPMVMKTYLGTGLRGLLITAFLAAFMSTIDTHLNWGASYIMTDVYQRFIKKDATQKHYMRVTKWVVVAMMFAGVGIALFIFYRVKSLATVWEFMAFLMIPGAAIGVLRWFWWRINAFAEIAALALGLIVGIVNPFVPGSVVLFGYPWPELPFEIKIAVLAGLVVPLSILVAFISPRVSKEKLEKFYRQVRPGGFWGVLDPEVRNLPGKAISRHTILDIAGGLMLCYGLSLMIGYAILLKFAKAGICLALAAIGGLIVLRWYKKEVKTLRQFSAPDREG
jgi:Na+/proline symporter